MDTGIAWKEYEKNFIQKNNNLMKMLIMQVGHAWQKKLTFTR